MSKYLKKSQSSTLVNKERGHRLKSISRAMKISDTPMGEGVRLRS